MTDPTTPTPDEIARWAALADGATPGPWHQATPTSAYLMCPGCEHGNYVAQAMDNGHYEHRHERSADAEFIAAARTAVPRLLALVAAQAEQIAEWEGGVAVTRSRLLAAELDAGLVIEASRTRADKAEAELHALHATDDYQRWARVVAERDAAREAASELRARVEAEIESWHHTVVDDCWYTCPAATEEREGETCCDDDRRGAACDCGLDFRKAKIRAALDPEPPR